MKKAVKKKVKAKSKVKPAAKPKKAAAKSKPKKVAKAKPAAKKVKAKAKPAPKKVKAKAKPAPKKAKAKARPVAKKAKASPASKSKNIPARNIPAAPVVLKKAPRKKAEKKPEVPKEPRNFIPVLPNPIMPRRREEPARRIMQKPLADQDNRNRYSDKELEEFRDIINQKLKEARKELVTLQAAITNANEHGTDDTANTFKMLEDGSDSLAKEEAGQLAGRQKKFIEQLENALVRIENKTYGVCRVTGLLIPKERLRAVPHTTQSIEAKMNQNRD